MFGVNAEVTSYVMFGLQLAELAQPAQVMRSGQVADMGLDAVSRRAFFGQAALGLGALGLHRLGFSQASASQQEDCSCVGAAFPLVASARTSDGLVGLVASAGDTDLVRLEVDGSGRVTVGHSTGARLRPRVIPTAMTSSSEGLLVGATEIYEHSTVVIHNSRDGMPADEAALLEVHDDPMGTYEVPNLGLRPVILRLDGGSFEPAAIPNLSRRRFAGVSALGIDEAGALYVAIDESADDEFAQGATSAVYTRSASGSWDRHVIQSGLGAGGPTLLGPSDRGIVVVSQNESRTHVADKHDQQVTARSTPPAVPTLVAAAATSNGSLQLYARDARGRMTAIRQSSVTGQWSRVDVPPPAADDSAVDVVQVGGLADEVIVMGRSVARIVRAG
jgi:hypothetical protein